jgi:hypothetical protein
MAADERPLKQQPRNAEHTASLPSAGDTQSTNAVALNNPDQLSTVGRSGDNGRKPDTIASDLASAREEVNSLKAQIAVEMAERLKMSRALESATETLLSEEK